MLDLTGGFEFQGLYVFPIPNGSASYAYFPLAPSPEMDSKGRPTFLSIPLSKGGLVQLGTRLEAREETLQALRAELATRLGQADAGQVNLTAASLKVYGADLEAGDGTEEFVALAHSDTSGLSPYAAVFLVQADATQQAAVSAALNGRAGFLRVSYAAALQWPVQVEARMRGDARDVLAALAHVPAGADLPARAARLLDEALTQGKVQLEVHASDHAPDALTRRASDQARVQFIALLVHVQRGDAHLPDEAAAQAVTNLSEFIDLPLTLVTDVSTWFGGTGADHIILPP